MGNRILVVLPTLGERLDELSETLAAVDRERESVDLTLVVVLPAAATQAQELARAHGAVIVHDPGLGMSAANNAGIAAATDERYYCWIGDDDLFRPGGLRILRDMLDAKPDAVVAYGACDYIDPDGRTVWTSRAGRIAQWLLPWGPDLIPHPGSMFRIDALQAVGLYDTQLKYAMDLDVYLKLRKLGPFLSTTERVSAFRWHPGSLTVASRENSGNESMRVKVRHLPPALRRISPLWNVPVQWAANVAANRVSRRALRAG